MVRDEGPDAHEHWHLPLGPSALKAGTVVLSLSRARAEGDGLSSCARDHLGYTDAQEAASGHI